MRRRGTLALAARAAALLLSTLPLLAQEDVPSGEGDPLERALWAYEQRAFPLGSIPDGARLRALQEIQRREGLRRAYSAGTGLLWSNIGPAPIVKGQIGLTPRTRDMSGRVAALATDPTKPNHWLAGAAGGGIWETTNGGTTWTARTDDQPSLAMGALAFAPSDPLIVYAGTGEGNYSMDSYAGAGPLISRDGGTTWRSPPAAAATFTQSSITVIRVHPTDARIAMAGSTWGFAGSRSFTNPPSATPGGIWKTEDTGETWIRKFAGDVNSLVLDPGNFMNQLAGRGSTGANAANGLYRSVDGGESWNRVPGPWDTAAGGVGRVEIAIAPSSRATLYVSVADGRNRPAAGPHDNELLGLWRTDNVWDASPTFTLVNSATTNTVSRGVTTQGYCQKQCWYDHVLLVDPMDENLLWAGGVSLWKCTTCRANDAHWTSVSDSPTKGMHSDQHALAFTGRGTPSGGGSAPTAGPPPTFQAPANVPAGAETGSLFEYSHHLTTGDFNEDGKLDVAVVGAESPDDVLAVHLGNGDGTFQPPKKRSVFESFLAIDIVTGDYDGDGHLDLVMTHGSFTVQGQPRKPPRLLVFFGAGDGTFARMKDLGIETAFHVFPVDIDNDGNLDILYGKSEAIGVQRGDGHGNFTAAPDLPTGTGTYPIDAVFGDFNGDGRSDIVSTNFKDISLLTRNADGTFAPPVSFPLKPNNNSAAAVDFNQDGNLDLAVTQFEGGEGDGGILSLVYGTGTGNFPNAARFRVGAFLTRLVAADFNGDCLPEYAITRREGGAEDIVVFVAKPDGTSGGFVQVPAPGGPGDAAAGDFNGDGKLDLVAVSRSKLYIALNSSPSLCSNRLVAGNDGGVWSTVDGGASWADHNTNLSITQFFAGYLHPEKGDAAIGSAQDNGSMYWSGKDGWRWVDKGDGADNFIASGHPDTEWGVTRQNLYAHRTFDAGVTDFQFVGPPLNHNAAPFIARMVRCPWNEDVVVAGSTTVWSSNDFFAPTHPPGWTNTGNGPAAGTISALSFAPSDGTCRTYAWGGSQGGVRITTDGGATFRNLDPGGTLPGRFVSDLAFDPSDGNVAYLTLSGFDEGTPGRTGHVFKSVNAFSATPTWTSVLPGSNMPYNAIAVDPVDPRVVWAGSDIGIWRSTDAGAHWAHLGPECNMPNVAVYEVQVHPQQNEVVAFTHGRGAYLFQQGPRPAADLMVIKTHSPSRPEFDKPITYRLTVTNNGPGPASGVLLVDRLPPDVELVSVTSSRGSCVGVRTVNCFLGGLAARDVVEVVIVVKPLRMVKLVNTAFVDANEHDPFEDNNTAVDTVTYTDADLAVTKAHTPEPVALGGRLTFTVTVKNNGPDVATAVSLTDSLPTSMRYRSAVSSQGSCTGEGPVVCFLGSIAVGQSATVTLVVTPLQEGTYVNFAEAAGNEGDSKPDNNRASDAVTVRKVPVITAITPPSAIQGARGVALKIDGASFEPGAVFSFQPSTGLEIVPPAPPDFGFVSVVEMRIVVNVAADAPLGERQLFVTNPGGASGGERPFNVFTVLPGSKIELGATSLDFGSVAVGQTADRTVVVRSTGSSALTVRGIASTQGAFQLVSPTPPLTIAAGDQRTLTVRFRPNKAGAVTGTLVVGSSDSTKPAVTVSLSGTGTAAAVPGIEVGPAGISFGSVVTGQSKTATLTLRNTGNATLTITSVSSDNAAFAAPFTSSTLAAGATATLNVTFSPTATGAHSGTLTIASNDPATARLVVPLRGDGAAPPAPQELVTDDGSVETGYLQSGLIVLNRLTPTAYPARLTKVRVFNVQFQNSPNPSGVSVRLLAYTKLPGTAAGREPMTLQPLVDQVVTLPPVVAGGKFEEFAFSGGPSIDSGDFYVGYAAPTPHQGVGFAADSNGPQQQRGWFSSDGGATFLGPAGTGSGASFVPINMMIRATVEAGVTPGGCNYAVTLSTRSFPPAGGTGSAAVSAPTDCPWTAQSNAPWLALTSGASGVGGGTVSFTVAPNTSASAREGTLTVASLPASLAQAADAGSSSATSLDLFVPILLSTAGLNGSFFTSELTLTNRGSLPTALEATYTAAFGGGGGTVVDVLPPGSQVVQPDALSYLRTLGLSIPDAGNRGGTLAVRFGSLSSARAAAATVRTTSKVADGRAGLSYPGIAPRLLNGPAYIAGLRQTESDRSNVALMNAGSATDGDIVLRVTVFSGIPGGISARLPEVALAPGGFSQLTGVLASNGLSLSSGYVKVERVSGTAPYYAYGVVNDQVTSDGSFLPPFAEDALRGARGVTVPVVVEAGPFTSDLVATNASTAGKTLRLAFVADAVTTSDKTATTTLMLAPGEQRTLPGFVQLLRSQGTAGIGPVGATYAGALFASVDGGDAQGLLLGVRTASAAPDGKGSYGLFYSGVPFGGAATTVAYVYGLQQNAENRANLALVNTGDVDGSGSDYRIELFDGDSGQLVATVNTSLGARRWVQLSRVLTQYAPGTANAYARVTRVSGNNQFLTYAVINDGGAPGERSGDGAFVTMDTE